MIVEVTQENINQGIAYSSISCPIALAMQDNGLKGVVVANWITYNQQPEPTSFQPHTRVHLNIDSPISQWMYDFDGGREVFPIQINIDEEEQYATLVE